MSGSNSPLDPTSARGLEQQIREIRWASEFSEFEYLRIADGLKLAAEHGPPDHRQVYQELLDRILSMCEG